MSIPWLLVVPIGILLLLMLVRSILIQSDGLGRTAPSVAEADMQDASPSPPLMLALGGAVAAGFLAMIVGVVIGGSLVLGSVAWLS